MSTNDEVQNDTSTDVGSEENGDRVPNEGSSIFDQEVSELSDMMNEFDRVMSLPDGPAEKFYPVPGRADRRKNAKRNRALLKRKPNG